MIKFSFYFLGLAILAAVYLNVKAQSDKPNEIGCFSNGTLSYKSPPADTPKNKLQISTRRIPHPTLFLIGNRHWSVVVYDSLGQVAERDSCGNWSIKDCSRALEVMYKIQTEKYKQ